MANGPYPSVGLYWFDDANPSIPPGMSAPLNQLLIRTDSPELYYKSGFGDEDWTLLAGGGGPIGPTGATGPTGPTGPDVTFTPGSIIFAGASGELAADPTQLFWDNTLNRVGFGTNTPAFPIEVVTPTVGAVAVGKFRASSNSGYSALQFGSFDPFNGPSGTIGYGNPGVGDALRVNRNFWSTLDDAGNVTDIVFVSNALAFLFHTINTEINLDMGSGVSAGLSTPNRGKLVYSAGGDQAFRVSCNGGVYQTLMTQSTGGAFTAGSVVFATGTGSFGQNNPKFFWDNTNNRLGLGTNTPTHASTLQIFNSAGEEGIKIQAGSTAGFADVVFFDSVGGQHGGVGYGGSTLPHTLANRNFLYTPGAGNDWVMSDATTDYVHWYCTTGAMGQQMPDGAAATVSAANTGKLRYNNTTKTWQASADTGAYVDFGYSPPYIDLRLAPYSIVANSSTLAVRNQNTAGIKLAIATWTGTKARLVLPDGDIFVERDALQWCVKFGTGVSDLTLAGQGLYATCLVQFCVGTGGELDLVIVDGAQRINFEDMGFRQDQITNPDPAQQNHLLCIYNNTAAGITKDIVGESLYFGKCIGDAIRMLANASPDEVSGLRFRDCTMQLNGVVTSTPPNGRIGARSGIAVQRGVRDAWFHDMTIAGTQNQAIDCEPTGGGSPCSDLWFDRMRVDNALGNTGIPVTLGGQIAARTVNISLTNSEIIQGQLAVIHTDDCLIDNVVVRSAVPFPTNEVTFIVRAINNRLQLRNSTFARTGTTAVGNVIDCENAGESTTIENCTVVQGTAALPMYFDITNNLRIRNCNIQNDGTSPAARDGITIFGVNGNANNIQVDGVQLVSSTGVMQSAVGCYLRAGRTMLNTRVTNVSCAGSVTRGFLHNASVGTNFDPNPVLTGWEIGNVKLWRSENNGNTQTFTLFPIVAGNRGLDSSRTLNGDIAPLGNCVGQLGDRYVWRPTTTTANTYRKASETVAGTPDNLGWEMVEGNTLTPAALAGGTTNDYAPAGIDSASWLRQDASAASVLTGILVAAAALGNQRPITITNLATNPAFTITLNNEDVGSAAGNRFTLPGAVALVIPSGGSVQLVYDLASLRWRPVSTT